MTINKAITSQTGATQTGDQTFIGKGLQESKLFAGHVYTFIVSSVDNTFWALDILFASTVANLSLALKSTFAYVSAIKVYEQLHNGVKNDVVENVLGNLKVSFNFLDVAKFFKALNGLTEVDPTTGNLKAFQNNRCKIASTLCGAASDTAAALCVVGNYANLESAANAIGNVRCCRFLFDAGLSKIKDCTGVFSAVFGLIDTGNEIVKLWNAQRSTSPDATKQWFAVAGSVGKIGLTVFKTAAMTYGYASAGVIFSTLAIADLLMGKSADELQKQRKAENEAKIIADQARQAALEATAAPQPIPTAPPLTETAAA